MPDILHIIARRRTTVTVIAGIFTMLMVGTILMTVDGEVVATAWEAIVNHPVELALALASFFTAFVFRAMAWTGILPGLPLGQALAALHVTLGANHLLPFRMGEPLRVVSVVRRTSTGMREATASTVTLRAADIITLVILGITAGLGRLVDTWLMVPVLTAGVIAATLGVFWLRRLRVRRPGPATLVLTLGAWVLESVVVWQVARWSGLHISAPEAVLVTTAAVVAQILAIAPGGFGTYEAGGVAALVFLGHDPSVALAIVLVTHGVKTVYSLLSGAMAVFLPEPGLLGRIRMDPAIEPRTTAKPRGEGPVVLFLPAHNEEGRVGSVVERISGSVDDRAVVKLVIDDGSDDATAAEARAAGAKVVSLSPNRGLGGAVREGIAESLRYHPVAIGFCDADGEYAPEELGRLVGPIVSGRADYVVGSRFSGDIERMLPHRRFGNRVLTVVLSWMVRRRVGDGQSGYRAFSPEAAASVEIAHDYNYAQVITLDLLQKGFRYEEVPISYSYRDSGDSFVKLGRYLRAVIPAMWREVNHRAPEGSSVASILHDVGGESTSGLSPEGVVDPS